MAIKILLVGSVFGKMEPLIKRINSAASKAGPFAAVLCVGQFFEEGDAGQTCPTWFQACIDGTQEIPAPLYFVGGDGAYGLALLGCGPSDQLLRLSGIALARLCWDASAHVQHTSSATRALAPLCQSIRMTYA